MVARDRSKKGSADAIELVANSDKATGEEKKKFVPKKKGRNLLQCGGHLAVFGVLAYSCLIGRTFYRICYPIFEEVKGVAMVKNKVLFSTGPFFFFACLILKFNILINV